jgi:hypothetical protein
MPLADKIHRHSRATRYAYDQGTWQENKGNVSVTYGPKNQTSPYLVVYLGMAIGGGTTTTPDTVAMDNPTMLYGSSQASFDTSWKSFEFNYFASGSGDSHAYRLIGWNIPASAAAYPIICSSGQSAEDRYGHGVFLFEDRNTTMDTMDNRIKSGMLLDAPASQTITATKDSAQVGLWTTRGTSVQSSISPLNEQTPFLFHNLPVTASAVIGFNFQIWQTDDRPDNTDMDLVAYQGLGGTGNNRLQPKFKLIGNNSGIDDGVDSNAGYANIEIIEGTDLEKNKMIRLRPTKPTSDTSDGHEFLTLLII